MESDQLEPSNFQTRLAVARGLLKPRLHREPVWPVVASGAFFAVCAMGLAAALITTPTFGTAPGAKAPPGQFTPVVEDKK